jgi:hypothetical protein
MNQGEEPHMTTTPAQTTDAMYPVQFAVDYPDRPLNRLTSAFRIFVAIPILIVLSAVSGSSLAWSHESAVAVSGAGGMLVLAPLLMILFRRKYPRWWFDWNLELQRFTNRIVAYLALMDDHYPSTDEQQGVKWLLVIPHLIVLLFLWIAALVVVVLAWFAILFTGRYPRGMFGFVEGVLRWGQRVIAYAFLMVTDRYPPFSLNP